MLKLVNMNKRTEAKMYKAVKLRKEGYTLQEIGDMLEPQLSRERVRQLLIGHNIPKGTVKAKKLSVAIDAVLEFPLTMSTQAISNKTSIPVHYINRAFESLGITYAIRRKAIFFSCVDKNGGDDCWEWTGYNHPVSGYGTFSWYGKSQYAHRVAYEIYTGKKPNDLCVLHKCDILHALTPTIFFLAHIKTI